MNLVKSLSLKCRYRESKLMNNIIFRFLFILICLVFLMPKDARAACASPVGEEGEQVYNSTHDVMQFCDGTDWISMSGGGDTLLGLSCSNGEVAQYDGSDWVCSASSNGGNIQAGIDPLETNGAACTNVGELARTATGDLLVCENTSITNQTCASFTPGALSLSSDGKIHACMN